MSDTPKIDAQLTTFDSISKLGKHFTNKKGTVSAEFARNLERELNQWKSFGEFATQVIRECVVASYPEYREAMKRYNELIK